MRPTPVRTILIAATFLSVSAVSAGAQLSVTQNAGCPTPVLASPVNSADGDTTAARATVTSPDSAGRASSNNSKPDIVLLVAFSADELRFNSQPDARIRFCWGGDSLHIVERRNLPSPVVAGTTYRNVFIAAELRAYLNAECLSQRLGVSSPEPVQSGSACATMGLNTSNGTVKTRPVDATSVLGSSR
jgi:hypothetical protein